MKEAHDKLAQELTEMKCDRDQLFPVRRNLIRLIAKSLLMVRTHSDADRSRRNGISRLPHMLSLYA